MKWTPEQDRAITSTGKNLLISAAAGSGKTAVLTERIVNLLVKEPDLDIDKILVVTFTKAATAEMKKRILDRIIEYIDNPNTSDEVREHLKKQLTLIQNSYIATLDSFCGNVARKYFTVSGVSAASSIVSDEDAKQLSNEVLDDLLEEYYEQGDTTFKELAGLFFDKIDTDKFRNEIQKLHSYILNFREPFVWLENATADYDWLGKYKEYIREPLLRAEKYIAELNNYSGDSGLKWVAPYVNGYYGVKSRLGSPIDPSDVGGFLPGKGVIKYPGLSDVEKTIAKECYARSSGYIKEFARRLSLFDQMQIEKQIKETEPVIKKLIEIVEEFDKRYADAKERNNIVTFSDMKHKAYSVLKNNKEAADYYKNLFRYVFVDEYQDNTDIDDAIVDAVAGENNAFRVGDVKQCIYGFRQASPELFIAKAEEYAAPNSGPNELIKLSTNFRSRKEVLDSVNEVFEKIMRKETVGIPYEESDKLIYGNEEYEQYPPESSPYKTEYHACIRSKGKGTEDCARITAERIRNLIDSHFKIYDKELKTTRDIKYGDITILTRYGTKNEIIIDSLGRLGIPSYAGKGASVSEQYDIILIMSYLRIIDNPLQDIPLLTVMRSPLYDFSDEEIASLAAEADAGNRKNTRIYELLKKSVNPKEQQFCNDIKKYAVLATDVPVSTLVWRIITDTGYYKYVGDDERQFALRHLFDMTSGFEKTKRKGLHRFISYYDANIRGNNNTKLSSYSSGANAVCIDTIHQSKGLEYPVVFLLFMGTKDKCFFYNDPKLLVYDKSYGIDIYGYNPDTRKYETTFKNIVVSEEKRKADIAENMRLLYVAMTRAKEKLIVVGSFTGNVEMGNRYLSNEDVDETKNFGDWIIPTISAENWELKTYMMDEIDAIESEVPLTEEPTDNRETDTSADEPNPADWQYPSAGKNYIKSKMSVTELKRLQNNEEGHVVPYRKSSRDMKEKKSGFSATEQGTILHEVLRRIDFSKCIDKTHDELLSIVNDTVDMMVDKGFILEAEREAVLPELIINFLQSEIGQRAAKAESIQKELPFTLLVDGKDVNEKYVGETVMQGIIDCCFTENGQFVVVDYKSDKVKGEELKKRAKEYSVQINEYSKALTKITGIPVKEKYLFFLREGQSVEVTS